MDLIMYRRVSTSEQGKSGLGLDAQKEYIEQFARREGHVIIGDYEEVISGKHGLERRPQLRAALAQAQKQGAIVIVSRLDRLSRSASFILNLMEVATPFASAEDGLDAAPLQLHIKAVFAENERRIIGERTRAALQRLKAAGKALGGITMNHAIGVARSVATNKAEADAFAQHIRPVIERMRRDGMSVNTIAAELNQQGNKTARGGKWHAATVANVMRRWS